MTVLPSSEPNVLLDVKDVESYYGSSKALFGMTFDVREREVVTLIGRNGMGKSTTVKTIMGMLGRDAVRLRSVVRISAVKPRTASPALASGWCRKVAVSFRN